MEELLDVGTLVAEGKRCAICQTWIGNGELVGRCRACDAPYHQECWIENAGCAAYGCELMPQPHQTQLAAVPQSHWGLTEKQCPACGRQVKVMALRCRFCGAQFADRAPSAGRGLVERGPPPKNAALLLFIGGIVPVFSPLVLVAGGAWLLTHRSEFARLPSTHRAMAVLGILAACVSLVLFVLVLAVRLVRR